MGNGISPATPDHSENRSTSFVAASARSCCVICAASTAPDPSIAIGSFFAALPDPDVSIAICRTPLSSLIEQAAHHSGAAIFHSTTGPGFEQYGISRLNGQE